MGESLFSSVTTVRPRRRSHSRKSAIGLAVGLSIGTVGLTIGSAGAATAPKQALANITLGASTTSINNLPIWVGQGDGFYTAQGLNVKFVLLSASTVTTALLSGSVNFLTSSSATFLQQRAQNDPTQVVEADAVGVPLGIVVGTTYAAAHGITAKTPLTTVAKDLIGSIGGASAPSTLAQGNLFLEEFGVQPSQVQVATLANPAADEAALEKNQINWFVTSEPIPLEMQAQGYGIVVGTPDNVAVWSAKRVGIGQMIVATNAYVAANPGTVRKFVRATEAATNEIRVHEQKVLPIAIANQPGVTAPELLKSYNIIHWPANGKMNINQWRTTVAFNVKETLIPHGFKVTQDVDWTNKFA